MRGLSEPAEALADYDRALRWQPDFALAHNNRGNTLRALGRYDEALAAYGRALQIAPDTPDALNNRGRVLRDLKRFDEAATAVPNDGGRVVHPESGQSVPGAYVAGWIKRGPTGFIGTNKSCSFQTVAALVADFNAGRLTDPVAKPGALDTLVHTRQPAVVDSAGWRAINAAEIARGRDAGRPRNKFTDVADMLAAAATTASAPPLRSRLLARLRDR